MVPPVKGDHDATQNACSGGCGERVSGPRMRAPMFFLDFVDHS